MILHLPLLTPYLLKEENDSTRLLQYGRARYGNYRRDRLRGNNRRNRPRGRNRRDRLGGNNRRGRNNNRKGTPRAVDPVGPCSWHSKKRDCRHDGSVLGAILVLATMNVDAKIKILEEALELAGVVINPIANTIQCVTGQEVLKALGIVSLNGAKW